MPKPAHPEGGGAAVRQGQPLAPHHLRSVGGHLGARLAECRAVEQLHGLAQHSMDGRSMAASYAILIHLAVASKLISPQPAGPARHGAWVPVSSLPCGG